MGGAIPLGIGAKLARPERPLMVATGDGCMLMHGMELHTAAREGVPLIIAVMNNQSYGNIYFRASKMGPGPERLTEIPGIDWVAFARSMGAEGERVEQPGDIAAAVGARARAAGPICSTSTSTRPIRRRWASGGNARKNGRTTTDGHAARSDGNARRCRPRHVRAHGLRPCSRRGPRRSSARSTCECSTTRASRPRSARWASTSDSTACCPTRCASW